MTRHDRMCFLKCILTVFLLLYWVMPAEADGGKVLSFAEPLKPLSAQIDWKIEATPAGLRCTITLKLPPPEKPEKLRGTPVGEYRLEMDGMLLDQDFFDQPSATLESILPFDRISNGEHTILLEVREFDGKVSSQKRTFTLNARPTIEIASPASDGGVFEPVLQFTLWGDVEGYAGMVDFFLDERPMHSVPLKKDQNTKKFPLSELVGRKLFRADLQPGTHLLKIVAQGVNGSSAISYLPIDVPAKKAAVAVKRNAKKEVERIDIQFPEAANVVKGSVDILAQQSVVLSTSAKDPKITVSRDDILKAFKKHKLSGEGPIPLVIATRTTNQVEDWQEELFQ